MTFITIINNGKGQQIKQPNLNPVNSAIPNFRTDKEAKVQFEFTNNDKINDNEVLDHINLNSELDSDCNKREIETIGNNNIIKVRYQQQATAKSFNWQAIDRRNS